jgi:hypothetical protein
VNVVALKLFAVGIDVNSNDGRHVPEIAVPQVNRSTVGYANLKDGQGLVAPLSEVFFVDGEVVRPLVAGAALNAFEVLP